MIFRWGHLQHGVNLDRITRSVQGKYNCVTVTVEKVLRHIYMI